MTRLAPILLLFIPASAAADGFEHPDNGSAAIGRAGATTARADDGAAIQYDVAALAGQRGTRLTVQLEFTDPDLCFQRAGTYDDSHRDPNGDYYAFNGMRYPEICDQSSFLDNPNPLVAISTDLGHPDWPVLAFGIYGPNSPKVAIYPEEVRLAGGIVAPAPNRYDLVERDLIVLYPTLAAAYAPTSFLRVGAAFQATFANLKFKNAVAVSPGSDNPSTDFVTELDTTDWFTPAGMLAAQARFGPVDVAASLRLPGDFYADGDVQFHHTRFTDPDFASPRSDATVHAPQDASLRLGARFFWARPEADGKTWTEWDAMRDEVFDVEADVVWQGNSAFDNLDIQIAEDELILVGSDPLPVTDPVVAHEWTDTISYRLGGDWNVLPNRLAIRLGGSYEPGASPLPYTRIDFLAFRRVGLFLGATYRMGALDLSLGGGHLFGSPRTVENGKTLAIGGFGPDPNLVITDGRYTASLTMISLGASYRF